MKQIGLFDNKEYEIPLYTEGQQIMVYDADHDYLKYNGLCGTIIHAPVPYSGYEVLLDTGETRHFKQREVMKIR